MRTALLSLCLVAFLAPAAPLLAADNTPYHIMWTNAKGKAKCCNKKSQEKADHCAQKMRDKGKATNVQVMAGKCSKM